MTPTFFATPARFRRWLESNHAEADELWVGFHRKGSGRPSLTWPESVDEALCFGWIDGVRRSVDADSYMIRFTPRRDRSIWSDRNLRRAEELLAEGRMREAGVAAYEKRRENLARRYSFEQDQVSFPPALEKAFRADRKAWAFFQAQPPFYRRTVTWWVISAKRESTRERRLSTLMRDSAAGRRIAELRRPQDSDDGERA